MFKSSVFPFLLPIVFLFELGIYQFVFLGQTSVWLGASDSSGFEDILLGISVFLTGMEPSKVGFGVCHPNPPFPDFCRRGNLVPIHISLHSGWLTVHLSLVLLLWEILGWLHSCDCYLGSWEGVTSFCPQIGFLTSFQCQAMECFCKLGLFLRVGAYSLEVLELWKQLRVVAWLPCQAWGLH